MCAIRASNLSNEPVQARPYKETCTPLPEMFAGPRIERLDYRVYPDLEAAVGALRRGEVDLLDYPVPSNQDLGPGIATDHCRDFGYYFVGFNTRRQPLDQKPFRKALAYLLDHVKREVAGTLSEDRVELMDSIMVQYYGRLVNRYLPRYETDGPSDAAEKVRAQLAGIDLDAIPERSLRCLVTVDDPIARRVMDALRGVLEEVPELARRFEFVELPRNEVAAIVYAGNQGEWHVFAGWNYVQDNLSRWNPGMSKLRLSLDWVADYQTSYSRTRNYVGFSNAEYDAVAQRFLTTLHPRDLRGAVITEAHLEPSWNNPGFWEDGGKVPEDANALLLLWKLQWMIADEAPLVPLFARSVRFARRDDVQGIWNGDPGESFTYPGGSAPIESTYPGGTLSYWTFQRVRKSDPAEDGITLGISNPLRHLNPLGVGNYWDSLVWSRIYESLLGLNPFLLMKGVAEDAVNLAESFSSEVYRTGRVRQGLHFSVKPGVLWHDGNDLTSYDVAFSFLSMLGGRGRLIAQQHPTSNELVAALVNETPVPAWADLAAWLHHVEVPDAKSIDVYLTRSSRYIHEWFGDMPIVPMHVWRHLGPDFTEPTYKGVSGLHHIRDDALGAPSEDFSGWNGLVGTGPFIWTPGDRDALTEGGSLRAFKHYHNRT